MKCGSMNILQFDFGYFLSVDTSGHNHDADQSKEIAQFGSMLFTLQRASKASHDKRGYLIKEENNTA